MLVTYFMRTKTEDSSWLKWEPVPGPLGDSLKSWHGSVWSRWEGSSLSPAGPLLCPGKSGCGLPAQLRQCPHVASPPELRSGLLLTMSPGRGTLSGGHQATTVIPPVVPMLILELGGPVEQPCSETLWSSMKSKTLKNLGSEGTIHTARKSRPGAW